MGPDESFEENAVRELEEEMGIVLGSALAPQPLEGLFDFWYEDKRIQTWGRLFKVWGIYNVIHERNCDPQGVHER